MLDPCQGISTSSREKRPRHEEGAAVRKAMGVGQALCSGVQWEYDYSEEKEAEPAFVGPSVDIGYRGQGLP